MVEGLEEQKRVADVRVSPTTLTVVLRDGREISAPLEWFPKLKQASVQDRAVWEPTATGHGIHWPKIDEDLSVDGLLKGTPAAGFAVSGI
ncbi:MAG TPA: DUF2442 domain-containing protein [Rhizomicrobium sp.]|jgi:hypothetical protein|nr:DUF2442 domain-containing protein [Rhizomicrobium sp.]